MGMVQQSDSEGGNGTKSYTKINGSEHGLHTTQATYGNVVIFIHNLHPSLAPSLPPSLPSYLSTYTYSTYLLNFIESFLRSMTFVKDGNACHLSNLTKCGSLKN